MTGQARSQPRTSILLTLSSLLVAGGQYQPGYFRCLGGTRGILLPPSVRCDGYPDCPHGEDERGCAAPAPVYPRSQFFPSPSGRSQIPEECFSPPPQSGCPVFWLQPSTRWFYNPGTGSCSQFQYTCGRGFNNFDSLSNCRSLCQPHPQPRPQTRPKPQKTRILTRNNFPQFVYGAANSLVEFYADWCGACQTFSPQFERAAATLQSYNVQCGRVNVDRERQLALQYGVTRLPYLVLIRNNTRYDYSDTLDSDSVVNWVTDIVTQQTTPPAWIVRTTSRPVTTTPAPAGCAMVCTREYNPVCGEDGVTYSNQCVLEVEECETKKEIKVLYSGECRAETPCLRTEFRCQTDRLCVSYLARCDGRPDCRDGSDEAGCQAACSSTEFRCKDGSCIPFSERCDGSQDCLDDEEDCPAHCGRDQFRCNDGTCISLSLRCDRVSNCQDKTDEIGCLDTILPGNRTNDLLCPAGQFECEDQRLCVEKRLVCDGKEDCGDGSDEEECSQGQECPADHLTCGDGSCVDNRRRCDGHSDCNDGADEVSCLQYECAYWQLKCEESGVCVHSGLACDGRQDCPDGTDEINCHTANNCTADQFTCVLHQECIDYWKVCNGAADCSDGSDEADCDVECGDEQFRCSDNRCIAASERCDGYQDCDNDEDDCPLPSLETTTSSPITTEEENVGFTDLVETTSPWTETETEEVPVVETTETGSRPECNVTCAEMFLPVCGDNGVTYNNSCLLKLDSCVRNINIQVDHEGDCPLDLELNESLTTTEQARRDEGSGWGFSYDQITPYEDYDCTQKCDGVDYDPVCGDDGITYDNLCQGRSQLQ